MELEIPELAGVEKDPVADGAALIPDVRLVPVHHGDHRDLAHGTVDSFLPVEQFSDLRISDISSHPDPERPALESNHWLAFSGFWVDVPGWNNARFPPFTRKIAEIADWADGAYEWNWSDLPMAYRKNNRLILNYLASQLDEGDPSE